MAAPHPLGDVLPDAVLAAAEALPTKPAIAFPPGLVGRWVSLEPLDVTAASSHLHDLHAALCGDAYAGAPGYDAGALVWMFMRGAAFEGATVPRGVTDEYFRRLDAQPDARMLVIRDRASGLVAGATALLANRPRDLAVEIGAITISPPFQGTPVNTEATWLLLQWAFDAGYRRLEWKCNAANARSVAAARRLGFVHEGVFRRHMIVRGHSRDTAWFSMLAEEWEGAPGSGVASDASGGGGEGGGAGERGGGVRERLRRWLASDDAVTLWRRRRGEAGAVRP